MSSDQGRNQRRRRMGQDATRQAIIDIAREIIRREGAAALSLHEVARRLGMRTPSLYNYFASKAALYDAIFLLGVRRQRERVLALLEREGHTWAAIAGYFRLIMEFVAEHPDLYQLVYERPVPGYVPGDAVLAESVGLYLVARDHMAAMMADGIVRTGLSPEQALDLVIAVAHGLASQHLANEPHLPGDGGRFGSLVGEAVRTLQVAWSDASDTRSGAMAQRAFTE